MMILCTFLPFQPLTTFVWFRVFLLTTHQFVGCLATTTYLCWLCHTLLPDKECYFVCLLTVIFSLAVLHGMHLLVPTHLAFFWVICHPSKTSPPKESKQKPQNRFFLLPTARPYPLLPLTHDLPFLYWLGTGWQCLGLVRAPLPVYIKSLFAAHTFAIVWRLICAFYHSSLTFCGENCFLIFLFFIGLLLSRVGFCLIVGFSLFSPFFAPSIILLPFLPYHYVVPAMVLFDSCLLGLLHVHFSIGYNDPIWSLDLYSYYFGLSWPLTLLVGSFGLFLSPWASLAHLLSLGILGPFSNSTFSWIFTNSFGFSQPNYLILHLGAHGFSINPLLSSLLRAYYDPLLLF